MPGSYIVVSPNGATIYVGDENRIQKFDTDGNFTGEIPFTGGALPEAGTVRALAVDPTGDLYFAYNSNLVPFTSECKQPNVHRIDPVSGEEVGGALEVDCPGAVATDEEGNVYVFGRSVNVSAGDPRNHPARILQFDPFGKESDRFLEGAFNESTGLATSSACGIEGVELLVSNISPSFVRIYGPPSQDFDPPCDPPPDDPPAIEDQYAVSVGTDGATVRAEINPIFWNDTRYYVQYGTGKCSEGGCEEEQPLPPGLLLTNDVKNEALTTAGIFLGDLAPDTTYHYRFVAESSGGGPVFGVGATEGEPQGEEGTFRTFPPPASAKTDCPNQQFRIGLAAPLPDCRAYEMVSPLDKNSGDIGTDEAKFVFDALNIQLVSPDGARATYSSFRAFADPEAAPLHSQFLSSRDSQGWSTHSISPPRTSVPFFPALAHPNATQFKAFSEDLCNGWFMQDTDLALVEGAPPGVPNVYRRADGDCGAGGYELITVEPPPGFSAAAEPADSEYGPAVQGVSADSSRTLLRAPAVLTPDACTSAPGTVEGKGLHQLYLHASAGLGAGGELHLVSILPSGKAACEHSSGGTAQGPLGGNREDSVHHALSANASRVFWSESPTSGGEHDQPGPLYLRLNPEQLDSAQSLGSATGTGNLITGSKVVTSLKTTNGAFAVGQSIAGKGIPAGTTITAVTAASLTLSLAATETTKKDTPAELNAFSECIEPEKACTLQISAANDTRFWHADPAGTHALYTTGGGLFEFDVAAEESTAIAATSVKGVMGASSDLSRVYFVSTAALTGEAQNSEGDKAITGQPNLYLYERSVGFTFVATLSALDTRNVPTHFEVASPIATLPDRRTSRVSPDGLHVAFSSAGQLTGHDNTDLFSGEPDTEVFLYDAQPGGAGELACLSCNRSGARPRGRNIRGNWIAATIPGWEYQLHPSRALLADGARVFFESFEPLVLRDTNGKRDVYEWERASSEEECTEQLGAELYLEEAGGCISLISSGQSAEDSDFVDASADGADVFFFTASSLLPHDFGLVDIYDARVNGGFPPPKPTEPSCEGEACQPAPPPPDDPTPATSAAGHGNVVPGSAKVRCPKGKRRVTRGGKVRCVKKKKRAAGRSRRASR